MGLSRETYYGPFLVYKPVMEKAAQTVRGCPKCGTGHQTDSKLYCGVCGCKHETYEKQTSQEKEVLGDFLYSPLREGGVRVAIPNIGTNQIREAGGYSNLKLDEYGEFNTSEYSEPTRAISKFTEVFCGVILILTEVGAEPEVRFGVFNYYN